jgi:putative beta-lysine N-acetyltransferase
MKDIVLQTSNGSLMQHGKYNDRIYLMKLANKDIPDIIDHLNELAYDNSYGKIFARIPLNALPLFKADGYISEAYIPGYINGKQDVHYVSKFLNSDRLMNIETDMLRNLSNMLNTGPGSDKKENIPDYDVSVIGESDAEKVAALFRKVFKTYPFPIHDPDYLISSMRNNTVYFGIQDKNKEYIAVSSAEVEPDYQGAEMTDFAILKSHRGKKLSIVLLTEMEKHMSKENIKTLYTIARLNSPAMNKTFLRLGYKYTGTLIKNTNISGRIESMNILYKQIKKD